MRFDDFKSVTRDQTVEAYVGDAQTIRRIAGQCLKRVPLNRRLRLLGVRVASLVRLEDAEDIASKSPQALVDKGLIASKSIVTEPQLFD